MVSSGDIDGVVVCAVCGVAAYLSMEIEAGAAGDAGVTRSEQILIHDQGDSAAQSRLVPFVRGPEPGTFTNGRRRISASIRGQPNATAA